LVAILSVGIVSIAQLFYNLLDEIET